MPAAAQQAPNIPAPEIPRRVFRITDYGAVGDGKTLNTEALKKAVAACEKAGGGVVEAPAGRFLTGPFALASRLELRLDRGATLLLSDDTTQYTMRNNRFEDCITARGCHDLAITGEGAIDGQGAMWWRDYVRPGAPHRPFLIVLNRCTRVLVKGVTLRNSPMFHLVPQQCRDVRIEGITIRAPEEAKNTDGLDPSGWNFLIIGCTFDVGDDCIALKPTGRIEEGQPSCRDFLITECVFQRGHGLSIGGQTPGGLNGMTVRNCDFHGTDAGIRMKASRGFGGLVENLTYENLRMRDVKVPIQITSYYKNNSPTDTPIDPAHDLPKPVTPTTPVWRHIRIRNVHAEGAQQDGQLFGLPEAPVSDVVLTDVHLSGRRGMRIVHARGIRFERCDVTAQVGAPVALEDAEVTGLARTGRAPAPAASIDTARVFDVRKFGAVGDGRTTDTAAIERALAACERAGGGRVVIPAGTWLTGPIHLRSGVELRVEPGARVVFSRDHDDYPLVVTRYEGLAAVRCRSPLWGEGLHDVAITGEGVFDGGGETWRPAKRDKLPEEAWAALVASGGVVDEKTQTWWPSRGALEGQRAVPALQASHSTDPAAYRPYRDFLRPTLLELSNCRNVTLDGPTFQNSPSWDLHLLLSDDITVRNVTAFNYWWAQNGDGMDLDSCRRVRVEDSTFDAGDDGICLKSGKDAEGRRLGRPTEDVTIRRCTVYRGHGGLVIGSEMSGGVRRITAEDCLFDGTDIGLRFKSTRGRGGVVENVRASNIEMAHIAGPAILFDMYYMVKDPRPEPVSERTPRFRDFVIRGVKCQGAKQAALIRGLPEMPVEDITLEDVRIDADEGITLADARGITLRDVRVRAATDPGLRQTNVADLKLEPK